MQEFINLRQGGISVKDYSLKFTPLSEYAPNIVADSRAKMNKFVMEISDIVSNECRVAMLIPSMDISLHAEQIEEQKLKQVSKELKRTTIEDGNSSRARFEVQDKPKFKKRFPNQRPSPTSRINKGKCSTPKTKEEKGSGTLFERSICAMCGRKHEGKYLFGTRN